MAINPNNGVLDIINGTLKVSSIDIKQAGGFATAINTVARNDVLLYDDQDANTTFTPIQNDGYSSTTGVTRDTTANAGYVDLNDGWVYWPLQLPNSWHTEFDMHVTTTGGVLTYSLFNTSEPNHTDYTANDGGYKIVFDNTQNQIDIRWQGSVHATTSANIRSSDWQHVNINYFQGAISISLAGKVVLTHKFTENYQEFDSRYVGFSATSGASHKIRHLIVHNSDKWLYTKTSNASDITYVSGNVGIGTLEPTEILDVHGNVHIAKDLTVDGNLTVSGTTTFIDTQNLAIEDPIIEVAKGNASDTIDAGLVITRPTSNVAVAYRGDEDELALGYTQSGASDTDVTPIADGGLDVRVYGNLFANNLTTTANVEAAYFKGNGSELTGITLESVVDYGNTTSNTIQLTNADVGLVATGNVEANYFVGDGSKLTGLVTTLESVTDNGNTTSNTVQFTNATTALIAESNVGIGTSVPSANLHVVGYQYVNDPPTQSASFDHSDAPLTLTHLTPTSTTAIDDPKAVLHLTRDGTQGSNYGAKASFKMSRYENSGTASRSRLDVTLADGTYTESNVMSLRADGKVGVGTTNPGYTLDVAGDINLSGDFYQGGSLFVSSLWTAGADSLYYRSNVEAGTANLFVDTTQGYVGIGTTTPTVELDIVGNVHVSNNISVNSLTINTANVTTTMGLDEVLNVSNTTTNTIQITNTSDTALNVTGGVLLGSTTGRVGIGTINPRSTLDINATDALIVPNGTTAERPSTAVAGMLRYNSTTGYFEAYTPSGWGSIATPPSIASISPNTITYANVTTEDITVTGSFFDSGSSVQLEGADGTSYDTSDFTFVDNATIRFRMGTLASGQAANRPYKVVVTNGAGLTTKSTQTLDFGRPTITSFSPNTIAYANVTTEDITVSGSVFDSQSSVQLEGADATLYNTSNFTFDDNATIRFRVGTLASGQAANRPYKVVVTNATGFTTKSTQTLGFEGPTWSSPASGSTQSVSTTSSAVLRLSATDVAGGSSVSYSLVSGSLPSGLSLSGNTISGTSTDSIGTTRTVTIRATDTVDTSAYTDLTFTIETISALYAFTSHTFTSAGVYGRDGPTLTQLRTAYSTASWAEQPNFFNVSAGIQEWTVPNTGTYRIRAVGSGSYTVNQGGYGADITGTCTLNKGEVIKILVGQICDNSTSSQNHCGGGGTFVVRSPYNTNASIIVVAGGGGGAHSTFGYNTNSNASLTTSGNEGWQSLNNGGTNGNAGGNGSGYGGAGFFGNNSSSAKSFTNGGQGDAAGIYPAGFGGGGRHGSTHGGGGGGYSGGGGSTNHPYNGGGGGSYTNNITVTSQASTHDGNGYVVITMI